MRWVAVDLRELLHGPKRLRAVARVVPKHCGESGREKTVQGTTKPITMNIGFAW